VMDRDMVDANEIAQSECATGKTFARYWMHSAFMNVDGQKMSKSLGNTYLLSDVYSHDIHEKIIFRYWLLTAHYRTQVNFTWEAIKGASAAYQRLYSAVCNLGSFSEEEQVDEKYRNQFEGHINNDLNTSAAVALLWDLLKDSNVPNGNKLATIFKFDEVLGLDLKKKYNAMAMIVSIPEVVFDLKDKREIAREAKNFPESDRLRDEIAKLGYGVKDTPEGQVLSKL